jgi:orotate phosphoribosyltransferase
MSPGADELRRCVLLDDVVTTGGTLARLGAAAEARGWEVVAAIVALDKREVIA